MTMQIKAPAAVAAATEAIDKDRRWLLSTAATGIAAAVAASFVKQVVAEGFTGSKFQVSDNTGAKRDCPPSTNITRIT